MLCTNCKAKAVCRHYDYIINAKEIVCEVTKCDVFVGEVPHKATSWVPFSEGTLVSPEAKIYKGQEDNVALLNKTEERPIKDVTIDYSELSKKARKDTDFSIEALEVEMVKCPHCNKESDIDLISTCDICKTERVCPECASMEIDMDTSEVKLTCVKCELKEMKEEDEAKRLKKEAEELEREKQIIKDLSEALLKTTQEKDWDTLNDDDIAYNDNIILSSMDFTKDSESLDTVIFSVGGDSFEQEYK